MLPTLLRRPAPSAASLLRAASSSPLAATKLGSAFNVLSAPSTQASTNTASLTLVLPAGSRAETSAGVASVFKNFAFKVSPPSGLPGAAAGSRWGQGRRGLPAWPPPPMEKTRLEG